MTVRLQRVVQNLIIIMFVWVFHYHLIQLYFFYFFDGLCCIFYNSYVSFLVHERVPALKPLEELRLPILRFLPLNIGNATVITLVHLHKAILLFESTATIRVLIVHIVRAVDFIMTWLQRSLIMFINISIHSRNTTTVRFLKRCVRTVCIRPETAGLFYLNLLLQVDLLNFANRLLLDLRWSHDVMQVTISSNFLRTAVLQPEIRLILLFVKLTTHLLVPFLASSFV